MSPLNRLSLFLVLSDTEVFQHIVKFFTFLSDLFITYNFEQNSQVLVITYDSSKSGITRAYGVSRKIFLPDKELRYRRTVIVTAAVYWSLNPRLCIAAFIRDF